MKKLILLAFVLLINVCGYSQELYKEGVALLQNGEYAKADSVITLSIKASKGAKNQNKYFNRAIARLKLKDMKGYCMDMKRSSKFDKEAKALYCKTCVNIDTIFYDADFKESSIQTKYKEIIIREKYRNYTEGIIYGPSNNAIAKYYIVDDYKYYTKIPDCKELNKINKIVDYCVKNRIKYPKEERDAYNKYPGTQSTIKLQFDISLLGEVANLKILNSLPEEGEVDYSKYFRKEVLRVFNNFSLKEPLHFMGESIVYRLKVPVRFDFPKR